MEGIHANHLEYGDHLEYFPSKPGQLAESPHGRFFFSCTENFFLLLLPALYWGIEDGIGLRVGIILLLSTSVNDSLKLFFHGPRPYWYSTDIIASAKETSFGVPSGHAQIATGI
jgi:membrane-associated phospholipid phosphatase